MSGLRFSIEYPITMPSKPYPIEAYTIRAAIRECGIDWTDAPAMLPAQVMATCPIDGLRVLASCVSQDWRKTFRDLLGRETDVRADWADEMCEVIRRLVDAVTELYSEGVETVAIIEGCYFPAEFGGAEDCDIDSVKVDGVEMSSGDFAKYIDRAKVKELARAQVS